MSFFVALYFTIYLLKKTAKNRNISVYKADNIINKVYIINIKLKGDTKWNKAPLKNMSC